MLRGTALVCSLKPPNIAKSCDPCDGKLHSNTLPSPLVLNI